MRIPERPKNTSFRIDCFFCGKAFVLRLNSDHTFKQMQEASMTHWDAFNAHKNEQHKEALKNAWECVFKKWEGKA